MGNDIDITTSLGKLRLKNPVMTASGTFGYGKEFEDLVNIHRLGAIVAKGISKSPRPGNKPPRIVETQAGMLNAIGLENVGVDRFLAEKMEFLKESKTCVVANILGDTIEDYQYLSARLEEEPAVEAIEVNISCPNVKEGGVAFGTDKKMAAKVTAAVKKVSTKPIIIKLSPNVTDIAEMAVTVENEGADCVSLINTITGMAIDARSRKPVLANIIGGLSGPAIKPIALRMVWQVAQAVRIPVIGIGGISTAEDAIEFLLAGAAAIQIGTINFINPKAAEDIVTGIKSYLEKNKFTSVKDIIGGLQIN